MFYLGIYFFDKDNKKKYTCNTYNQELSMIYLTFIQ